MPRSVNQDSSSHPKDSVSRVSVELVGCRFLALGLFRLGDGLIGDGDKEVMHPPFALVPTRPLALCTNRSVSREDLAVLANLLRKGLRHNP